MSTFPSQGDPAPWGTALTNALELEHNSDGSHKFSITDQVKVFADTDANVTGDGALIFVIPPSLNGRNLTDADAYVTTVSSSGLPTIQVHRVRSGVSADMLSTRITIDANENTSYTAATPAVIDTANDDIQTGDLISVDVDGVGTGSKGLGVVLTWSVP